MKIKKFAILGLLSTSILMTTACSNNNINDTNGALTGTVKQKMANADPQPQIKPFVRTNKQPLKTGASVFEYKTNNVNFSISRVVNNDSSIYDLVTDGALKVCMHATSDDKKQMFNKYEMVDVSNKEVKNHTNIKFDTLHENMQYQSDDREAFKLFDTLVPKTGAQVSYTHKYKKASINLSGKQLRKYRKTITNELKKSGKSYAIYPQLVKDYKLNKSLTKLTINEYLYNTNSKFTTINIVLHSKYKNQDIIFEHTVDNNLPKKDMQKLIKTSKRTERNIKSLGEELK